MIVRLSAPLSSIAVGVVASLVVAGCATTKFQSALSSHRWSDASQMLDADTSLLHNESTLFQAAMLYTFPNRDTYNPDRARGLFEQLLKRYPETPKRQVAVDQLSLLYELKRVQTEGQTKGQELESQIAKLASDTLRLRTSLDSMAVRMRAEQDQSATLRKVVNRLENDLQEREAQLRTLHSELDHLKEIDLKHSVRPRESSEKPQKASPSPAR